MGFAENLKEIRTKRSLSQEELAEMLGVSRQAVSKWEQGSGYPEVETLLLLSRKLNISLDRLMDTEVNQSAASEVPAATGMIVITSPHENVMLSCSKVLSSGKFFGGKASPQYALFGANNSSSFWGETTTFWGWYANKEQVTKEISEIQNAIVHRQTSYTLQYSAKTTRRWTGVKIIKT